MLVSDSVLDSVVIVVRSSRVVRLSIDVVICEKRNQEATGSPNHRRSGCIGTHPKRKSLPYLPSYLNKKSLSDQEFGMLKQIFANNLCLPEKAKKSHSKSPK